MNYIKPWIPGKKLSFFLATVTGLGSYKYYDNWVFERIQNEKVSQVAVQAQEPMKTWEVARKVSILMHGNDWAKYWFNTFVKKSCFFWLMN